MFPGSIRAVTFSVWISSRVTVKVSSLPSRSTVMTTSVPFSPLTRAIRSSEEARVSTSTPSAARITSPASSPAWAAGPPAVTAVMV